MQEYSLKSDCFVLKGLEPGQGRLEALKMQFL